MYPAVFSRCDVWMRGRVQPTPGAFQTAFSFSQQPPHYHHHHDTMKIYAAALLSSLASAVVAFESTVPCLMWSPKEWVLLAPWLHSNAFNVIHDIETHCIYKQLLYTYHGCHWTVHCWQRWCRHYHLVVALTRHLWCQVDCCRWPTRRMCILLYTVAKRGMLKCFIYRSMSTISRVQKPLLPSRYMWHIRKKMLVSDSGLCSNIARMLPRVPSSNTLLIVSTSINLHNWFLRNVKVTWYKWLLDKVRKEDHAKRGLLIFWIGLDIDQDARSPTVAVMSLPSTSGSVAAMQENGMCPCGREKNEGG